MGQTFTSKGMLLFAAAAVLTGCLAHETSDDNSVSMFGFGSTETPAKDQKAASESLIISALQYRRSVLPNESSFERIATSVLAANSRAAEAELRSARLRAEAQSKNWLPTIGPNISLTSLGALVASLVVEQVLFDNGRKKAERDFAKADVEVAAVNLAIDTNQRVLTALELYLTAEEAREKAAVSQGSLTDMGHFEWIMTERVKGGISDASELNVLHQKLSEIKSSLDGRNEAVKTAMAELNAMAIHPVSDLRGLADVRVNINDEQPLAVLLSQAEKEREIARATAERASFLPGLTATGTVGKGNTDIGLGVKAENMIGLGTGANLKAIEATKDAANRRVGQAREDSNRSLRRMEQRLIALARQVGESTKLTSQAKANLDMFQEQYDAGQRQVMDVVGVYETYARQAEAQVSLKYEMALTRLKIANELGFLADGSDI